MESIFLELVRENEPRLRRICRVYAVGAAGEEDLYQDILVQLWRSLPSFRGDSRPDAWLYRVALNTALAHRRRMHARPAEVPLEPGNELPTMDAGPDARLERRQRRARLYAAIGRLNDIDRAVVTMYLDGQRHGEIAAVLGISENNAAVKLHRIRKRLADWLNPGDAGGKRDEQ